MMVMILIMKIVFPAPDSYVKDINSILKINKKVCSQVYLGECILVMIVIIKMVDNFLD